MERVVSSVTLLCCSLFGATLIKMLAPTGKTEKIIKTVIGIFIVIALVNSISGVLGAVSDLQYDKVSAADTTLDINRKIDDEVIKTTAAQLVIYADSLLKDEGIEAQNIRVNLTCDENSVINIKDIFIYIDETYKDKATEIIENSFGVKPKTVVES